MLKDKEIIYHHNDLGLTYTLDEVEYLSKTQFPVLIFQEFLKQLKMPYLSVFTDGNSELFQSLPDRLQQADETIVFKEQLKSSINKTDLLNYYLLCRLLKVDFNVNYIFVDASIKNSLVFQSSIPFSKQTNADVPQLITHILHQLKPKTTQQVVERFFILIGHQFKDKLLIFLTFLESKYRFKMNKKEFINSVFNTVKLNQLNKDINQLIQS